MPGAVVIIKTGTANLASVLAAWNRLGVEARVSDSVRDVNDAAILMVPGVGAFGAAMEGLQNAGLVDALRARVQADRPTLGICVGMQVFCEGSAESPGVRGIAAVPGTLQRFGVDVRVPQLGWNEVTPDSHCALLQPGYAYYANSFRLTQAPQGWAVARTSHGAPFVAALERGPVLLCQFHPELSGPWGASLLSRWVTGASLRAISKGMR